MTDLNQLAREIHDNAVAHGFWEGERNFGEQIALMHSELSEALEEHRAGRRDHYHTHGKCPASHPLEGTGSSSSPIRHSLIQSCKPEGAAVELVDCIIRALDTLAAMGVDVDAITAEKMAYNASRPFKHGKAY